MSPTTTTTANVTTGPANVSYTVTGLNNAATYDLALFTCANVDTSTAAVKFLNSSNPGGTGNVALQGIINDGTSISVVNGTSVWTGDPNTNLVKQIDISPSAGQITFTINAGFPGECVVPVLYGTADGNNDLNLGTNNQPTDSFGVGGAANFVRPATAGSFGGYNNYGGPNGALLGPDGVVTAHSGMTFTTDAGTFTFKTTDSFFTWNGTRYVASTEAAFAAAVSAGDNVAGIYQPTGTSTFVLDDVAPVAPGAVTKVAASGLNAGKAGIQLSFGKSDTATVDSYNVYRATGIQPVNTGAPVTCPTASSAFAKLGSVTATDALNTVGTYTFVDGTATPPAVTGSKDPSYCYRVTAVDGTSESVARASLPLVATAATTATGAPKFISDPLNAATRTGSSWAIEVVYDQAISAVDAGDFTVVYTNSVGTQFNLTVGAPTANNAQGTVTMTATTTATVGTGGHVVVTAHTGDDLNTVGGATYPVLYQAGSDSLFITTT